MAKMICRGCQDGGEQDKIVDCNFRSNAELKAKIHRIKTGHDPIVTGDGVEA